MCKHLQRVEGLLAGSKEALKPSWLSLLLVPWWSTTMVEGESVGGELRFLLAQSYLPKVPTWTRHEKRAITCSERREGAVRPDWTVKVEMLIRGLQI